MERIGELAVPDCYPLSKQYLTLFPNKLIKHHLSSAQTLFTVKNLGPTFHSVSTKSNFKFILQ